MIIVLREKVIVGGRVYDDPNANPADWSNILPPGLVLALRHYPNMYGDTRTSAFGVNALGSTAHPFGFLSNEFGGDLGKFLNFGAVAQKEDS